MLNVFWRKSGINTNLSYIFHAPFWSWMFTVFCLSLNTNLILHSYRPWMLLLTPLQAGFSLKPHSSSLVDFFSLWPQTDRSPACDNFFVWWFFEWIVSRAQFYLSLLWTGQTMSVLLCSAAASPNILDTLANYFLLINVSGEYIFFPSQ